MNRKSIPEPYIFIFKAEPNNNDRPKSMVRSWLPLPSFFILQTIPKKQNFFLRKKAKNMKGDVIISKAMKVETLLGWAVNDEKLFFLPSYSFFCSSFILHSYSSTNSSKQPSIPSPIPTKQSLISLNPFSDHPL